MVECYFTSLVRLSVLGLLPCQVMFPMQVQSDTTTYLFNLLWSLIFIKLRLLIFIIFNLKYSCSPVQCTTKKSGTEKTFNKQKGLVMRTEMPSLRKREWRLNGERNKERGWGNQHHWRMWPFLGCFVPRGLDSWQEPCTLVSKRERTSKN